MNTDTAARRVAAVIRDAGHPLSEEEVWEAMKSEVDRRSIGHPIQHAVDLGMLLRIDGHRHVYNDPLEKLVAKMVHVCQCRRGVDLLAKHRNTETLHHIAVYAVQWERGR
jgi:hypothetical protein